MVCEVISVCHTLVFIHQATKGELSTQPHANKVPDFLTQSFHGLYG